MPGVESTKYDQNGQSRGNRWSEAACICGAWVFVGGTILHGIFGAALLTAHAIGISYPSWMAFLIVPTLSILGLTILLVALPAFYFIGRQANDDN